MAPLSTTRRTTHHLKPGHHPGKDGFTLIEMLIVVAILGIIAVGLQQALSITLTNYRNTRSKQNLIAQGRFATERMLMFIRESDELKVPSGHKIEVSERIMDTHDNLAHAYLEGGDGIPDADDNANGIINDSDEDKKRFIVFDKKNDELLEYFPDYTSPDFGDKRPGKIICRNVENFKCKKLKDNLVEIELMLSDGVNQVVWKTRGMSRIIDVND